MGVFRRIGTKKRAPAIWSTTDRCGNMVDPHITAAGIHMQNDFLEVGSNDDLSFVTNHLYL